MGWRAKPDHPVTGETLDGSRESHHVSNLGTNTNFWQLTVSSVNVPRFSNRGTD